MRLRRTVFLGVGLAMTVLALAGYSVNALSTLELASVDARFALRGSDGAPPRLVVVKIDDVTFDELGEQWPFRRSRHAQVIDRIVRDGPRAIGYDVQFTEPTTPADDTEEAAERAAAEDNALIESVAGAGGKVVLATTEVDEGRSNVFGGDEVLEEIDARAGNALLPTDRGLVIRRVPYEVEGLKTFGIVTAEVALGREVARSELPHDPAWIDFVGPPDTVRSISFVRVLRDRVPSGLFRDAVVVVGPYAPTLLDVHPTSTSGDVWMSGAEIQANVVSTVLRGFPLASAAPGNDRFLIVLDRKSVV